MTANFSVLIPDGESPFAFHVLSCLHAAKGIDVHVLSRKHKVMTRYSPAKKSFHIIPPGEDSFGQIQEYCKRAHVDLIMPVDTHAIAYFAEHRAAMNGIPNLCLLDNPEKLQTVSDKRFLADFLHGNNLPHPCTMTTSEEFTTNIGVFPLPVLTKSRNAGNGEGITRLERRNELIQIVRARADFFEKFLVQEYVEGYDIDCSVLCRDGKILAYTIQKGISPSAIPYQPPEIIEFVHDTSVLEAATRMMETLKWTGIAHIDMRCRASDSQIEIIEVNPRFWGSIQGSLNAGVNFPKLMCLASKGETFPLPSYRESRYMSGFAAIKRIMKRQPAVHLLAETNFLRMLKDPLPNFMKLVGRTK